MGGLLVLVGLVAANGIGAEFGVLQQVNTFQDIYPSSNSCDWNQTGVATNIIYNQNCELNIEDLSSNHAPVEVDRYIVDSQFEWETGYQSIQRMLFNSTEEYEGYITPETSNQQSRYFTNQFYAESQPITVDYQYEERTAPDSITIELYDGQIRDSATLEPGQGNQDFQNSLTLNTSSAGQHELRIRIDGGTQNEQLIHSLHAYQSSSDLTGVASGVYQSEVTRQSTEIFIDRVEHQADDITDIGVDGQQTSELTLYGYDSGEIVASENYISQNDIEVEEGEVFENTTVDSYRFDVLLISESSETPEFSYVEFEGGTYDRLVSEIPTFWIQAFVFILFIGMALLYMARL